MSELVLHNNDARVIHEWRGVGSHSSRSYMGKEFRFLLMLHPSGWPVALVERGNDLKRAAIEPVANELARLAARVAELEGEVAKLRACVENCGMLARKKLHAEPGSDWQHIHRFCSDAGARGTVLRSDDAARAKVDNG